MPPSEIPAAEVLRRRLASQLITPESAGARPPVEVVRHLLALQAQDFGQAVWAIGLRARATRTEVLGALDRGEVIRSAPMRGTLHFVAAEDLRWMLALTAERTLASAATRRARLGLDEKIIERARQLALTELAGGGALTRDDFLALLNAANIDTTVGRGYHLIFHLAQHALICWGPSRQNQQALVLVDEWISPQPPLEKATALGEFARRYFTGHGPATLKDFAWWSKLTMADARAGLAAARDRLTEVSCAGQRYFFAEQAEQSEQAERTGKAEQSEQAELPEAAPALHALPGFDEYLLGYGDRDLPLDPRFADRIVPGANGIFLPVIVADGHVIGTWRRVRRTHGSTVVPVAFESLSAPVDAAFECAAAAFLDFVDES